ncbi:hypothetical protein INT43_008035 [Umbelopsis isabellina]|uniref:RhoGAP-domain-containing protein n=1 Tax=Mortierella isabellina TaxID=91625 RepID=A0A8H7PDF1_MORIS|nr:hypothetical protein INT43_008035 [Umbelopsis isabellina]
MMEASQQKQSASTNVHHCGKCSEALTGDFIRALNRTYHIKCFNCADCDTDVASSFFEIEEEDGRVLPLCERDYFRRLNLVCATCGEALKGSYITALGQKYHVEHFNCSLCSTTFGPEDSYYENDGKVYCHYHYSVHFAVNCAGCETAILKQFVEINRNNVNEHWHPECYMINRFWNVKLSQRFSMGDDIEVSEIVSKPAPTAEELKRAQSEMEDQMYQIWTVLSAFEESAAACISDMLLHVSNGAYIEGVNMAKRFITHVDILFNAIDVLRTQFEKVNDVTLDYSSEAKRLCKKIINFFSLLSHTQESGAQLNGITEELLSLVTGLAHYLKILIRVALTGALKLEKQYHNNMAIPTFLNNLMQLASREERDESGLDLHVTADLCQVCKITCEEECYSYNLIRWHSECFQCSSCQCSLQLSLDKANVQKENFSLYCNTCATTLRIENIDNQFDYVTRLQQYSFLLRVALRRLYTLLDFSEHIPTMDYDGQVLKANNVTPAGLLRDDNRSKSYSNSDDTSSAIHLGDIKRMKSTHMSRKMTTSYRVGKRSVLMETPSPTTAVATNESDYFAMPPSMPSEDHTRSKAQLQGDSRTLNAASANKSQRPRVYHSKSASRPKAHYLAEIGALDQFMVKYLAVLHMEQLVREYFTLEELVDLIDDKKNETLWGKFVTSLKAGNKKAVKTKEEGTFGVPFELLMERTGIESNLGAGPSRLRIPSFVEDSLSVLKQMDVSVEGIFRKNGNIRRLKELGDEIDKHPTSVNLANETPIQVAALLKKFLRELPEPLLTYKLYKLFVISQKLENEAERKIVLHLACCILPKQNRDTLEVLFLFLRYVATFSESPDSPGGSKMDTENLATVIAPNVLSSRGKEINREDTWYCTQAVKMLIEHQVEFCLIPEYLEPMLLELSYGQGITELNPREVLKRCGNLMKAKKSHSAGLPISPNRDVENSPPNGTTGSVPIAQVDVKSPYLSSSPSAISSLPYPSSSSPPNAVLR